MKKQTFAMLILFIGILAYGVGEVMGDTSPPVVKGQSTCINEVQPYHLEVAPAVSVENFAVESSYIDWGTTISPAVEIRQVESVDITMSAERMRFFKLVPYTEIQQNHYLALSDHIARTGSRDFYGLIN